ncbi:MAG: TIGR03790 family protein [Planctomycetota bacterium]|nr:TIGR03790 family protein [Planctomycetota bacterium]
MTIHRSLLYYLLSLAVFPAGLAEALTPQEVLVVANANAKGSEKLGKYYCLARNILPERMVVLRTTAGAIVSRKEYNDNIRNPLREFLTRNKLRGQIKCLVLMWGVPVRVLGTEPTTQQRELISAYKAAHQRLHGRLAVNAELLMTVGENFPEQRTETLRPVGALFSPRAAERITKPPEFKKLLQTFNAELTRKQAKAEKLTDRENHRIALRQLAALRLDTQGPVQWLKSAPDESIVSGAEKDQVKKEMAADKAELSRFQGREETAETVHKRVELLVRLNGIGAAYAYCEKKLHVLEIVGEDASVDSELSLLWEQGNHPLRGARPNPMFWRLAYAKTRPATIPEGIIMTARIDGPSAADALRIIKDSVETEKVGLKGKFYIDAGGKYPPYDEHLKKLAGIIKKHTRVPVVLDTKGTLFAPGSCPDAAMYVGWYSLRKYIPAFTWTRGAVGWHVASYEAHHLRTPTSDEWCVKMLQNGVAATLGAVNEPYLHAFPLPEDFFSLLLTGQYTMAECYWRTVPSVSWRLTLIADPLYNPFKLHPHISVYSLPPALTGRNVKSNGKAPEKPN